MVSSSTGYSRRSSSTDTTFPARWASSRVRGPMPGPISSTPVCSSAPQAAAMSRGTQPCDEEVLAHGLGKVKAVALQKRLDVIAVAKVHIASYSTTNCIFLLNYS